MSDGLGCSSLCI